MSNQELSNELLGIMQLVGTRVALLGKDLDVTNKEHVELREETMLVWEMLRQLRVLSREPEHEVLLAKTWDLELHRTILRWMKTLYPAGSTWAVVKEYSQCPRRWKASLSSLEELEQRRLQLKEQYKKTPEETKEELKRVIAKLEKQMMPSDEPG